MVIQVSRLSDDRLYTPDVAGYAERKYALVATMAEIVATGMKNQWDRRVYLDLFSGAGRARVRRSRVILPTAATLALEIPDPFDDYVFCDIDPQCTDALAARTRSSPLASRIRILNVDVNAAVDSVLRSLPTPSKGNTVLTMCVVDPFKMRDLRFATLRALSQRLIDFLVLIPSYMEAHRNEPQYCRSSNAILDGFLGDPEWRSGWARVNDGKTHFGDFIARCFGEQMKRLGFQHADLSDMELVLYPGKNVRLYHLAYFSKHPLAAKFWAQARKYSSGQKTLWG